ncbi:MAG: peptidase M22 [Oscillospiraceae bacterium]
MAIYLGLDTSNYTTSTALFDSKTGQISMEKKLLPTKEGSLGLRQSDAVFHHVKQLGLLSRTLMEKSNAPIKAVGVSAFPRRSEGSYMPCFLVGEMAAELLSAVNYISIYRFSHQEGHLVSALYSAEMLSLMEKPFLAFHLSGGTTDALLVRPGKPFFSVTPVAKSLDLKAGQVIDRVGVMLGLSFPCGAALTELALKWNEPVRVRASMKGADCCLSGIENKCQKLFFEKASKEYIARYCIASIQAALEAMTKVLLQTYGNLPLLYAGGVMSNVIIRQNIEKNYGGYFAEPTFSMDNSAGIAILAALSDGISVAEIKSKIPLL